MLHLLSDIKCELNINTRKHPLLGSAKDIYTHKRSTCKTNALQFRTVYSSPLALVLACNYVLSVDTSLT